MPKKNEMVKIQIDYTQEEFAAIEAAAADLGLTVEEFHRAVTREISGR